MDYPNLLENAHTGNDPESREAYSAEPTAYFSGETAPRALVWRQLRWVDRRPVLRVLNCPCALWADASGCR